MEILEIVCIGLASVILITLILIFINKKTKICLTYNSSDTDEFGPQGRKFTLMTLFKLHQHYIESRRRRTVNKEIAEPSPRNTNTNSQDHELKSITVVKQKESLRFVQNLIKLPKKEITHENHLIAGLQYTQPIIAIFNNILLNPT
jgi:hypothetical protein